MGKFEEERDRPRARGTSGHVASAADEARRTFEETMRTKADAYGTLGAHSTARFLADKALIASGGTARDTLRLARVHYASGKFRRALHLLEQSSLEGSSPATRLLAAQCLYAIGEFDESLAVLGDEEEDATGNGLNRREPDFHREKGRPRGNASSGAEGGPGRSHLDASGHDETLAAICLLRGKIYEELENADRAVLWYKQALQKDIFCYEAFVSLLDSGLLSTRDALDFVGELKASSSRLSRVPASTTASTRARTAATRAAAATTSRTTLSRGLVAGDDEVPQNAAAARQWVYSFYEAYVGNTPVLGLRALSAEPEPPSRLPDTRRAPPRLAASQADAADDMEECLDVLCLRAMHLFSNFKYSDCLERTRMVLKKDPFVEERLLVVHLAALVEIGDQHELFVRAHALVDANPREAVSWMAVGYYYYACGKFELARRYLQKATALNSRLGAAWVAFGHAFAAQDESDQAMAAYRTASRLLPGAALPNLFMGMEYARQSSLAHASSFFNAAAEASHSDPGPRHELGVVAYRSGDIESAISFFRAALVLWEKIGKAGANVSLGASEADALESTLFNLGHCYRRSRDFDNAKQCYERALSLRPRSASTCAALGMTVHAQGDSQAAVALYHRALRYGPEDALLGVLLERALADFGP